MPVKTMRDAINEALHQAMEADDTVFVIGEDVAGCMGSAGKPGSIGGVFGVTGGIYDKFGPLRCVDTPISESAIVGAASGAALVGMRPVAEIMFADFIGVCMDQIVNQMGKFRYMFGGKSKCPAVIRFAAGGGFSAAAQHSQSMYQVMTSFPGLKIVIPSNAYDAKGLMLQAIAEDDPVLFFEPKALYQTESEVPDEMYTIPFGEAAIVREGDDCTVVAFGQMVGRAAEAVDALAEDGITCDLIDPRTSSPLDTATILESVEATGRLVVVDESPPRCGLTADIAALAADRAFHSLKGPVKQVCAPHSPTPYSPDLEAVYLPSVDKIKAAIQETPVVSEIYPIAVPKWGIEMVEGTLNTWNKREGDTVTKGDEVFDMESDKIVNVWEAPVSGVLRRVIAAEGDTHPVGALLGVIASAEVSDADIDAFIAGFGGAKGAEEAPKPAAAPSAGVAPNSAAARTNPVVRKLAEELGVDLESVTGTGRRGRITQDDVKAAAADAGGDAQTDAVDVIPLSPTRKTIARRLTEAKQSIPHFYLTVDYELDALLAHRKQLNADGGSSASVNDLIVWCVAQALVREPRVNVNLVGDDIHQFRHANISVAIATDDGLYPATVRQADSMSVAEISTATAALADKARSGSLTKEDISGGSFTVSNLGMLGVSNFTAIINPPMGAILALGKGEQKMVVRDGVPTVATIISATLSCDHRVIDGAVGARFLQVLGEFIADPTSGASA